MQKAKTAGKHTPRMLNCNSPSTETFLHWSLLTVIACTLLSYLLVLFQHRSTGECPSLETGTQFLHFICTEHTTSFKKLAFSNVGLWAVWRHAAHPPGLLAHQPVSPETAAKILLCCTLSVWVYASHLTSLCLWPSRTDGYKLVLGAAVGFVRDRCYEISLV